MKEKPNSVSHKDWFVRNLAESFNIDKDVVDKVIKHQFEGVLLAMQKNKSVEISGFGKFIWNHKAALRKLDTMDKQIRAFRNKISNSTSELKISKWNDIIDEMLLKRQMLINRINEIDGNLRGLEESPAPEKRIKE
jgi:nucleoid DNA-binding protein